MTTGWILLAGSILFNVAGNLLVKQFQRDNRYSRPIGLPGDTVFARHHGVWHQRRHLRRALKDLPIVMAYPIQVGACILIIVLFAVAVFGERLSAPDMLGIALIVAGIALLSRMA